MRFIEYLCQGWIEKMKLHENVYIYIGNDFSDETMLQYESGYIGINFNDLGINICRA